MLRRCRSVRFAIIGAAIIASILASVVLIAAPGALADGDPASDVLVNQYAFVPPDADVPFTTQARLDAVLKASAAAGFPVRVALIASAADMGTVSPLWGRSPKVYARYLGIELSNLQGQILVVMPNGFGLYGGRQGADAVTDGELSVRALAPGPGPKLATAALSAVPMLAAAAGHPLKLGDIDVPTVTTRRPGVPAAGWIALALGALLIGSCWMASLKARPLSFPPGRAH